jgi:prophage regulatory protein
MATDLIPPGTPMALDIHGVAKTLGLSKSTVQNLVRKKEFPPSRLLSDHRTGWITAEVAAWLAQRPPSDLLPPPNTGAPKPRRGRPREHAPADAATAADPAADLAGQC